MGLFKKMFGGSGEGSWRTTGWKDTDQGLLNRAWGDGWFQTGHVPGSGPRHNPDVAAAVSLYKRALQAAPVKHIKRNIDGAGIEVAGTSALSDVLHRPNQYMTWNEFLGVIVDGLLVKGEFAAYVEQDARGRRTTAHPLNAFNMVSSPEGDIFYRVQLSEPQRYLSERLYQDEADGQYMYIPQRHVIHGRYEVDPHNHLRPLSPLAAYATSVGLGANLRAGQEAFHYNKAQPSGVLSTEASLTQEQATRLRDRWEEHSEQMKQGKTPILSNGLKFQPVTVSANEAQVIQLLGFTTKDIAKAYGIPPVMLGENSGVTYSNLEQLLNGWRTTGLTSLCKTIEAAFEFTFDLDKNEEMIIDVADLARSEALSQADTLTRLVQNGVMKPNEARARLDLAPITGVADNLVAQQQIQPMQQNADLASRKADHDEKLALAHAENFKTSAEAKLEAAKNPPAPPEPPAPSAPPSEKDFEAADLIIKGMFK